MNRVRSGVFILGGLLPALLLTAGGVFAQEPTSEAGAITGRVLEADGRRPVGQVDVLLVGTGRRVVTDARGWFRFEGVPAGEQVLRVRHLGFQSRELTVQVPANEILGLTIRLDPEPVALDPLDVQVESELRIPRLDDGGFYHRREREFGHFFGPQYLTKWSGTRLPTILARTPGIRIQKGQGLEYIIQNDRCLGGRDMAVYVDGVKWSTLPNFILTELAAVEVYKSPAQSVAVPFQGSGCGLLLIWTWHGPNPFHDSAADGYACPERLKRFRAHAC